MRRFVPYILFIALGFISSNFAPYQDGLTVVGWVYSDQNPIRRAEVLVWENGEVVSVHKSNRWGRFIIDLPLDRTFILSFSTPATVSKKLQFFTEVPAESTQNDDFYFEFIVELFEPIPWIDLDFLENPLATIFYDKTVNTFNYNKEDYEIMLAQLEIIKREVELFNMLDDEIKTKLKIAERHFYDGDYTKAFELLAIVSYEFPDNSFVQNKFQIVEKIIFEEQLALKENLELSGSDQNQAQDLSSKVVETEYVQLLPDSEKSYKITIADGMKSTIPLPLKGLAPLEEIGSSRFTSVVAPFNIIENSEGVKFMIQILATYRKPGAGFFYKIQESLPNKKILHYKDMDQLDKYAVGVFTELNQAMETLRVLRRLNYETYIIAFIDGRRVRVKEALAMISTPVSSVQLF